MLFYLKQTVSKILCGICHIQKFREVLIVNLPEKVPKEKEEPNLNGMLKTLLTPDLPASDIIQRLENIYHIPMTEQEKGGFGDMCNLGEAILERGIEQGVKAFVELCKEMGLSKEETKERTQAKFTLQCQNAEEYIKKYWK